MILPDNNNDILLIYADWLEDQGICTKELREEVENPTTNSWHFEYGFSSNGIGGNGGVGVVIGVVGIVVGGVFGVRVGGVGRVGDGFGDGVGGAV